MILVIEPDRVLGTALVQAVQEKTSSQAMLVPALAQASIILRHLSCDLVLADDRLSPQEDLEQLHTIAGCEHTPILTFALSERLAFDEPTQSPLGAIAKSIQLLRALQVFPDTEP